MRPELHAIDWAIVALYVAFALALGSLYTKKASTSVTSFFVGDRKLPWWIAGTSIVATTFAADTPLAVTGLVATGGISGNWLWWAWGIAHLTATFFFARMWRRSGVITDAEITEMRYSGRPAAALRGFKAVYFGIFINCLTMAWVIAAMVKISRAFFDVEPATVVAACVVISVTYTTLGGFRSVVFTDLAQFALGMAGALVLAWLAVDHFGGIGSLGAEGSHGTGLLGALETTVTAAGDSVADVLDFIPAADHPTTPQLFFVVLLIAGWWRYAEGNGYIVQRLAACKNESHAQGASLWFAVAHNALRPWPWLLVALAALVLYPRAGTGHPDELLSADGTLVTRTTRVDSISGGTVVVERVAPEPLEPIPTDARVSLNGVVGTTASRDDGGLEVTFGPISGPAGPRALVIESAAGRSTIEGVYVGLADREMGYPLLMGRFLPTGLLGLVIASLLAAFMSTIDTHTNWGASYLVRDLYQRFIRPDAPDPHYVTVSRLCIVGMAVLAGLSALIINNIGEVWRFLTMLGAGLGSVTAARWYWWRVTVWAEFAAMAVTTVLAVFLQVFCTETLFGADNPLFWLAVPGWAQILLIAGASLATWLPVAVFGPQENDETLRGFAQTIRPPAPGWRRYVTAPTEPLIRPALQMAAGLVVLYGSLFGIGDLLIGSSLRGLLLLTAAVGLAVWVVRPPRRAAAP